MLGTQVGDATFDRGFLLHWDGGVMGHRGRWQCLVQWERAGTTWAEARCLGMDGQQEVNTWFQYRQTDRCTCVLTLSTARPGSSHTLMAMCPLSTQLRALSFFTVGHQAP